MSKVPSQVEEAAELAEKLHTEMFNPQPDEETEIEQEEEVPAVEDTEQDAVEEDEPVPHDDDVEELRKFKARYLSLKGKYDAEVPRLQHELRDFKENVVTKLTALTEIQPQTKPVDTPEDDILSRLRSGYGEEFIDDIKLLAEKIAEDKMRSSLATVEQKVTSVEDTQLKMAQEDFVTYLNTKVDGEWQGLLSGENEAFNKFLAKPDPSGLYTYGDLLQLYNDQWEADKMATVLNMYMASVKPAPVVPVKPKAPNPEREAMVAPSRTTVHVAPDITDKPIWTRDSIKEFERADRQGKYSSEESQAMWADLMLAPSEGRLR